LLQFSPARCRTASACSSAAPQTWACRQHLRPRRHDCLQGVRRFGFDTVAFGTGRRLDVERFAIQQMARPDAMLLKVPDQGRASPTVIDAAERIRARGNTWPRISEHRRPTEAAAADTPTCAVFAWPADRQPAPGKRSHASLPH